jgi:ribosomal protein S18 acetylase RimI-like enzyme
MLDIVINEITSEYGKEYKKFFMTGLLKYQDKFRISPGDEINSPFPTKDLPDSFTLGAYCENELVGVVSFEREGEYREKLRHKGLLFRMYVSDNLGRKGIGKQLITALLIRVKALRDIEKMNLTVISDNLQAKSLYLKYGFNTFSIEERAIKYRSVYHNEEQMTLDLTERATT